MSKIAAEVFVEMLREAGVSRVWGIVGDSLNGITDTIRRTEGIDWLHVRHEEVAAFAAGGEAHVTGKLAVCAGSCGPGNLHLINGLYDCHRSRLPVLAIAAQIPSRELGTGYFQETHPEALFKDCSHYCEVISHADQVPRVLGIAMRAAITQRGVAVVVIPGDVATAKITAAAAPLAIENVPSTVTPPEAELDKAAAILNGAKRIAILGGAGCASAHYELLAVAERLKAPIIHALRGKEFIEYDNPYDVGMTGLLGFPSGYHAMKACDALLMLGTDFPYTQFFPENADVIQVDLRGQQIGRRTAVKLGLIGDVKSTLAALLPKLAARGERAFLDKALAHYQKSRESLDDLATPTPPGRPLHPQYVTKVLDQVAGEDAVFTADVGTPTIWACRYLHMNGRRKLIGSFVHGSMAAAMPQAIGVAASQPGRPAIALCGDGGLAMLLGDLLTLPQLKLPVKIVVFNNGALSFVELEMKAAGLVDYGTNLDNPSFAAVGEAMGIKSFRVNDAAALEPALRAALAHEGPALVDVVVARQELSMPPSIDVSQAWGFGLYMAKAILSGRGDEIVDLAKTNLLR